MANAKVFKGDTYIGKYIILICECTGTQPKNSTGLSKIINNIYEDGFEDGYDEGYNEAIDL